MTPDATQQDELKQEMDTLCDKHNLGTKARYDLYKLIEKHSTNKAREARIDEAKRFKKVTETQHEDGIMEYAADRLTQLGGEDDTTK